MPSSRPTPEHPKPPRDTAGCSANNPSPFDVAYTAPARIRLATRIALAASEDMTVDAKPNAVEFASITASDSDEKLRTERTGPNTSFCQTSESRGTLFSTVGSTKYPLGFVMSGTPPPVNTSMPDSLAASINDRIFCCCDLQTTGCTTSLLPSSQARSPRSFSVIGSSA